MNGYERIDAALKGNKPDRTPVMLHNFMMAAREAGYTQAQFRGSPRVIADSFIRAVEKYDYDGVLIDIDTAILAGAVGVPVVFPDDKPARSSGSLLADISEVDRLPAVTLEDDRRVGVLLESTRLLVEHFGTERFVRGNCDQCSFSLASMVRSMEEWMLEVITEESKPYVLQLLDYCTEIVCEMIRLMVETGAHMVSNGDSVAGPSLVSPKIYRELALPYERRVVAEAHRLGVPYALHICGNTNPILEDLVETGTDAVELDYLTDIHRAYEVFSESVCFVGNIDPSGVLALGSVDDVLAKTEELLTVYRSSPRFILNAGCAIPAETPEDNLFAMLEVARAFG